MKELFTIGEMAKLFGVNIRTLRYYCLLYTSQEYQKRGVVFVRYADDIVLLAKSERAAKRRMETSTKYLEGPPKLKVDQEKSHVVSVFAIRTFEFLGFTLGKNGKGIYVRVHGKSWKKMKA